MSTTKHNHGPNFGRKVVDCPRCSELTAGAPAVQWAGGGRSSRVARDNATYRAERERHFAPGGPHATGRCGPVCTAFDW